MKNQDARGAASTETVLLIAFIAIALLLLATVLGRKVQAGFGDAAARLDGKGAMPQPRELRADPAETPAGTERFVHSYCGAPPCTPEDTLIHQAFGIENRARIHSILEELPEALRAVEITAVLAVEGPNAVYYGPTRTLLIGAPLLEETGMFNDVLVLEHDADPRVSLERAIYHEMIHAYDHQSPGVAKSFLDLGYHGKYQAVQKDPRLVAAQDALFAAQEELGVLLGGTEETSHEWSDVMAAAEHVLRERPELRERIAEASRTITAILAEHHLPSRYPGDAHAGGEAGESEAEGAAEYFAIVLETARHDPEELLRWRRLANDEDPANDILSPAEVRWLDDHSGLWK